MVKFWISLRQVHDYKRNEAVEKLKMSDFTGYCTEEQYRECLKILRIKPSLLEDFLEVD